MGSPGSRITCAVRTLGVVTSQIFRCHGLQSISERADKIGCHDLAYWLIFVASLCAWFLMLFAPQRERLENLAERQHVLCAHLKAEKRELQRLTRSISDLTHGDAQAWERAARSRLGWLQPGEVTDIVAWNQTHNNKPISASQTGGGTPALPGGAQQNMLPLPQRPRVPPLPVSPAMMGQARLIGLPESIDPERIGLLRGTPPPLPPRIHVVSQQIPQRNRSEPALVSHTMHVATR